MLMVTDMGIRHINHKWQFFLTETKDNNYPIVQLVLLNIIM